MVRRLTRDNAHAIGLHDRGVLAPGYRADINVIDYNGLRLRMPEVVYDLPSGGRRLMQRAEGYVATIVAGQPAWRDGAPICLAAWCAVHSQHLRNGRAAFV